MTLDTGALPPGYVVADWQDLCLFLGGDRTSHTGSLLEAIGKADPANLLRHAMGFPREVAALQVWRQHAPLTAERLAKQIARPWLTL